MSASIILKFIKASAEDMVSLSISFLHLIWQVPNNMNTPYKTSSQITAE